MIVDVMIKENVIGEVEALEGIQFFTHNINNGSYGKHYVLVIGADRTTYNILCLNFNKWGHMYHNFTDSDTPEIYSNGTTGDNYRRQGINFMQENFIFTQYGENTIIEDTWMIMDTASKSSIKNIEFFVTDVRQCLACGVINVLTNGGL